MKKIILTPLFFCQFFLINSLVASEKIPIVIEKNVPGAPQLLGIPFPKDKLQSSDQVKVLNSPMSSTRALVDRERFES